VVQHLLLNLHPDLDLDPMGILAEKISLRRGLKDMDQGSLKLELPLNHIPEAALRNILGNRIKHHPGVLKKIMLIHMIIMSVITGVPAVALVKVLAGALLKRGTEVMTAAAVLVEASLAKRANHSECHLLKFFHLSTFKTYFLQTCHLWL